MVAAYARRQGKIGTFAIEDTGEMAAGVENIESTTRIQNVARALADAGGGMGWVIGPEDDSGCRYGLPQWSDVELAEIAKQTGLFDPASNPAAIPRVAVLLDPVGEISEYIDGDSRTNRPVDRLILVKSMYEAGLRLDPITVDDILARPALLDEYAGVMVINLSRLDPQVARILADYAERGGGLFVGGRTGIFNATGAQDRSALSILLGVPGTLEDAPVPASAWSFNNFSDPLLQGLSSQAVDTKNLYLLPGADWVSAGYTVQAVSDQGKVPSVLTKGKLVVWFPRLNSDDMDPVIAFIRNVWTLWGVP
jgi:hypothetical protein